MRIDPTLLTEDGDLNQLEPDLSGIDPALVQLSESMARAQDEGFHDSSQDLTSQGESIGLEFVSDQRPADVENILADFVSISLVYIIHSSIQLKYLSITSRWKSIQSSKANTNELVWQSPLSWPS